MRSFHGIALLVLTAATPARAQAPSEPVVVETDGPCVDAAALRFAAAVHTAQHPDASVAIDVRCGERVQAHVTVSRGDASYERSLEIDTAELASLADALALIVAVGLEELPAPPAPEPVAPEPAVEATPEDTLPPAPVDVTATAAPRDHVGAALGVVVLGGLAPDAAAGASLLVEWRSAVGVGVELEGAAFAPSEQDLFEGRIAFWSVMGRAAVCALVAVHELVALGGCAGVLLGATSAEASRFRTESFARWEAWLAIEGRARAELSFDAIFVRLDAILAGVAWGPSFYVERARGGRATAHVLGPVLGGAAIALGVRFTP